MTPSQITEYYRKSGEATAKKYGFKIAASAEEAREFQLAVSGKG